MSQRAPTHWCCYSEGAFRRETFNIRYRATQVGRINPFPSTLHQTLASDTFSNSCLVLVTIHKAAWGYRGRGRRKPSRPSRPLRSPPTQRCAVLPKIPSSQTPGNHVTPIRKSSEALNRQETREQDRGRRRERGEERVGKGGPQAPLW